MISKQPLPIFAGMGLPEHSVTLPPETIAELDRRLSEMRHNINNHLALLIATTELIRRKPDMAPRFLTSLAEQPEKITGEIRLFSDCMESVLGVVKD